MQSLATLLSGASQALCGSQFFHALVLYMQLPPPGMFLPNFVELWNLRVWVQRSLLSEAFLCPSSGPLQPSGPLMVPVSPINHPLITQGSEARGSGQALLLSVCPGSGRGSLERPREAGGLGLNPRLGGEGGGWILPRVDPVPLIAAGQVLLELLLYLLFSCDCSCSADSCAPEASRSWEYGLPRGLGSLGASGLQDREVCDDQELAGGRPAKAAAAWGCGLRGRVRERPLATLAEGP